MANVCVTFPLPPGDDNAAFFSDREKQRFLCAAQHAEHHRLVDDPSRADLVLIYAAFKQFCETSDVRLTCIRDSAVLRAYEDRCIVYNAEDFPFPYWRGIYPALGKRWRMNGWSCGGPYLHHLALHHLEFRHAPTSFRHLFSLRANLDTHPIRRKLAMLESPSCPIEDTAKLNWKTPGYQERYADQIHDSLFVLCPRGRAPASIRVFETMRAGRVPVIYADDWDPPEGPDWNKLCVIIPERDWERTPAILQNEIDSALEKAATARQEWLRCFSSERIFDTIVDYGLRLLSSPRPSVLDRVSATARQAMTAPHLTRWLRSHLHRPRQCRAAPESRCP